MNPHLRVVHSPSATDLLAQAREASVEEVDAMLKAADALQDALNRVVNTNLAPVGVLAEARVMLKGLIGFSNNCVSFVERK